ncbi:MAG: hypothetical protein PHR82_09005 [Endomicrobiaceae bacterium]|nr:hypothetical protein [Endomicrobiaceae bacterium]
MNIVRSAVWDVFEGAVCKNPREPGKYLGSIEVPQKWNGQIDENMMKFDLHLRASKRHAYGESYNIIKGTRTTYNDITF